MPHALASILFHVFRAEPWFREPNDIAITHRQNSWALLHFCIGHDHICTDLRRRFSARNFSSEDIVLWHRLKEMSVTMSTTQNTAHCNHRTNQYWRTHETDPIPHLRTGGRGFYHTRNFWFSFLTDFYCGDTLNIELLRLLTACKHSNQERS